MKEIKTMKSYIAPGVLLLLIATVLGAWFGVLRLEFEKSSHQERMVPSSATEAQDARSSTDADDTPMLLTSERSFIELMVPHHEEAIVTAREVLERGGTSQGMTDLANNIITSQTAEVALMKESYEVWFGEPYQDTGEYRPMMRELAQYSGITLDQIFLHDMTMHHMGAIMMSRSVQPHLKHDVMEELTESIIVNQSREIETMQQLARELRDMNPQ